MKDFKTFCLTEGDTKAAFDMERVIVSASGGPKFVSKLIPDSEEVGKKIASKLGIERIVIKNNQCLKLIAMMKFTV